jgi:hypothetical protein
VRLWSHLPIYHSAFKIHHLAPATALLLEKADVVRSTTDEYLAPVVTIAEKLRGEAKKMHRKWFP